MKASVFTRYGSPDVLEVTEVPKPVPKTGEVLIRVHATTVSRTDCGNLRPLPPVIGRLLMGLFRPKYSILGMDFAGTIDALGSGVESFKTGERVFGLSDETFGAHAEYLCVPANGAIASVPDGICFEDAVVGEGAWYADTYLRQFGLARGHNILIYGASGAVGTAAVQLAKDYGAEVTAVVATRHVGLVHSLGADRIVDYTVDDFTEIDERFDFVLDAVGKTTFFQCRGLLKTGGVFAATDLGPWWQNPLLALWFSITGSRRVISPVPKRSEAFIPFLKARMEAGQYRAVVDRRYPLEAIVDAYRYVESAQKTGIVVINVVPVEATSRTSLNTATSSPD